MKRLVFIWALLFLWSFSLAAPLQFFDVSDQVISTINLVREDPVFYSLNAGISMNDLNRIWGRNLEAFYYGLLPLRKSEALTELARSYILKMVENGEVVIDQTFSFPVVRVEAYMAFEHAVSPEEAVKLMLSGILIRALKAEGNFSAVLFPPYTNVGVAFAGATLKIEGVSYNVYALVLEIGIAEDMPVGSVILGRVSDNIISIRFFNESDGVTAFIWPCGIYYAPVSKGIWYAGVEEWFGNRKVKSVYKIDVNNTPYRRDFH